MPCRSCGRPIDDGARFCPACGTPVAESCRNCGAPLAADARFCAACGTPRDPALSGAPPERSARERKVATILFADIVGFTGLSEAHDPELVQSLVGGAFERLSAEVARYEGIVEKFAGDAMLALFGIPQAHEDDPERAVRAALEMQVAIAEQAAELRARGRPELQLRIGIETGEVLVDLGRVRGERDRMVTGDPVNTSARLQSVSAPGSIIVGPGTYAATREVVEYEELESLELKGKALPVPAWRAIRVKARRGGARTPLGLEAPLIGRDEELGILKETVRRLTAENRPHLVTVLAAAGVGKSRLVWELEKYLDGLPETYHWRKGRSLSYGQASYGGLIEIVRTDCGIREDDTEEQAAAHVERRLDELRLAGDAQIGRALEVLLGLPSAAPQPARDELFEGWRRHLEAIARVAPLILVLEDIHWADEGLLDFLDFLARWAEAPILLLCMARHELIERRPGWGGGIPNSATIVLEPLAPAENEALLDALLPGSLPAAFKQRIVAVAEGNPLFSEELVRMLIDRGAARPTEDGWELVAPVEELEIPGSIQALLAARLDSLPGAEKRVTQAAAVVGRIFWDAVLAHVVASPSMDLDRLLRGLRVKELVVPREPSSLADAREFGFRHVLIRDVAYESVPKSERADQHLAVARWAESRLAAREEELLELLASHYSSALAYREEQVDGDDAKLLELRRNVLEHALRAGRRALDLWEGGAAVQWFRRAFEQARRLDLPPLEFGRITNEYLRVAILGERPEDALAAAVDAAARLDPVAASETEAQDLLGHIQANAGYFTYEAGRGEEARELLERALERLGDGPPRAARARLLWRLGWLTWRAFSPAGAVPVLERAADEARAVGDDEVERWAIHDLGVAVAYSGRPAEGLRLLEQSLDLARAAADQTLLLRCSINLPALMSGVTWDQLRADAIAREGLDRARRGGHRFFVTFLAANLAESASEGGRRDEAAALLEEARTLAHAMDDEALLSLAYGYTAGFHARYGTLEEAAAAWAESARHGPEEPQGAGRTALVHAILAWADDHSAAVTKLAADLTGATIQDVAVTRLFAAMAARAHLEPLARATLETISAPGGTPKLDAEAAWRDALLGAPSAAAVATIVEIGERYLEAGQLLTAADAFLDAALVARRAGLDGASELEARGADIYARTGARHFLPDRSLIGAPRPVSQPAE